MSEQAEKDDLMDLAWAAMDMGGDLERIDLACWAELLLELRQRGWTLHHKSEGTWVPTATSA